jgi:hypothetical protein
MQHMLTDGSVNKVLELITEGKYAEAAAVMEQYGLKASPPWQIKTELSSKVEAQLEHILRKVRKLSAELPLLTYADVC